MHYRIMLPALSLPSEGRGISSQCFKHSVPKQNRQSIAGLKEVYMNKEFGKDITLYGSTKDISSAEGVLKTVKLTGNEATDRITIQSLIDRHRLKASILYRGNSVWSKQKVLKDFKKLLKTNNTEEGLTDYLYKFFHLECGTIAHFSKNGWALTYPDNRAIRRLFIRNEYGKRVLEHQPAWASDRKIIITEIEKLLGIYGKQYKFVKQMRDVVRQEPYELMEEISFKIS